MARPSDRPTPPHRRHRVVGSEAATDTAEQAVDAGRRGRRHEASTEDEFWGTDTRWTSPGGSRRVHSTNRSTIAGEPSVDAPTREIPIPRWKVTAATSLLDPTDPIPAPDVFDDPLDAWLETPSAPQVGWDVMDWDVDAWHADDAPTVSDPPASRHPRRHGTRQVVEGKWEVVRRDERRRLLDPAVIRLGILIVVVTLAVPFVLAMTSGSSPTDDLVGEVGDIGEIDGAASVTPLPTAPSADPTTAASPERSTSAAATAPATPSTAAATTANPAADEPVATPASRQLASTTADDAAEPEPSTVAATAAPACAAEYEIAAGDYWIRLADGAGVRLADLLAANGATIDTMLVPGRSICLPAGASMPSPPPTTATPTTTPRTTTSRPPATAAPTTAAPPTTSPPATAPPTTVRPATRSEAEAIIREIWPDELEERALQIAWRESNYVSTAKNWCCYGLFQIHWNAHRSWLGNLGITSSSQLLDARTNATAAYTLYQRAGGFGPWGG